MGWVQVLVVALMLGLIPAIIAKSKGRSFFGWWAFGATMFLLALPCALLTNDLDATGKKKCPTCAEMVRGEAEACRHCNHSFANARFSSRHPALPETC